jgi:hypoxanthine phosphoribosyltransferase
MTKCKVLFTSKEIALTLERLAAEIRRDYQNKNPIIIGILKGSFIFLGDLVRSLHFPLEIDFVSLSSYKENTTSCGDVSMNHVFTSRLKERHLLVVEDIVDTGITLNFLLKLLHEEDPASVGLCALLDKPSCRKIPVNIDYLGFTIHDKFVVGYGMDLAEQYRNLSDIRIIEKES